MTPAAPNEIVRRYPRNLPKERALPYHHAVRFGSVCSGIEAATVAWEPLG